MKKGRARTVLVAAVAIAALVSCADPEERSLCTAFERFQESADSLQEVSLDGATAGEAADSVEAVLGEVRNLDAVADTRYSSQINQLEEALDDLLRTLESIQEDAESDTWEPLVSDSVEDAQHAASVVTELIVPVCESRD
jgi:CHAD domain-containing protein